MAPNHLALAIDAGTTGVTALLMDTRGQVVAIGYQEFRQHFPAPGWVEHELSEIWSAVCSAVRQARSHTLGVVSAVGITNQRETVCFWDPETLGQVRPAIVWQDRRTAEYCSELAAAGLQSSITAASGLRLDPYFTASKLAWIARNEPHVWAGITSGQIMIGTVDTYLVARLSRGVDHITDATNASRTMLYDLHHRDWSPWLCETFGVPVSVLPRVGASYGALSQCEPSVLDGIDAPITAIIGDQQGALFGHGAVNPGGTKCTYGTGSFLLQHTGQQPVVNDQGLLTTIALAHPDGTTDYALEGSVFVTGAAVQWLRDGLGIIDDAAEIGSLAASVPDSAGVVFVPALTGLGAPDWDPSARGTILGITRSTTAAHIARATLDAITMQVCDVVDLMRAASGISLDELHVDGGPTSNTLLMHLQADALGAMVTRSAHPQTTALGAALLAGLGAGWWQSPREAVHQLPGGQQFPCRNADARWRATERGRWRAAVERSKGWDT